MSTFDRVKGENEMTKKILRDNAIGKEESTTRGKALDWLGVRLLAVLPAVFPSARADDVSSAFAGYAVQPVPAVRTLRGLEPFIMGGRPIVEVEHEDVKGRTRLVRMEAEDGRSVLLAIGLKQDNECRFKGDDGHVRTFAGKAFSCEIIR